MTASLKPRDGADALEQGGAPDDTRVQKTNGTAVLLTPPGQIALPEHHDEEPAPAATSASPVHVTMGTAAAPTTPAPAVQDTADHEPPTATVAQPRATSKERLRDVIMVRLREMIIRRLEPKPEPTEPPSMVVLWMIGGFTVGAISIAFIVSYTFLHAVTLANGMTGWVAGIAPLAPDLMSLAAAALLVYQTERVMGWALLLGATGMSVIGNLAGHAIYRAMGITVLHFPPGWSWVGDVLSVFIPTFMAALLHVFLKKLSAHIAFKKKQKEREEAAEREAQQARDAARREEQRRAEQVAAEQRRRKEAQDNLPWAPTEGKTPNQEVGKAFALAFECFRSRDAENLARALKRKNWAPGSFSGRKKWIQMAAAEKPSTVGTSLMR